MSNQGNLLLSINQIEKKINGNEWIINFQINFDYFILSLSHFYGIYKKKFNFEDLIKNELFKNETDIKTIINRIIILIDENKYEIKEDTNNINLILNKRFKFKILKKEKDLEGITKELIKGIKTMEEKMENIKKNNDIEIKRLKTRIIKLEKKIKEEKNENKKLKGKIEIMKNENDEKNKKIELVEEDKNKIENNKDFLNNNNKDKKKNNDDNYIICEYNIKNKNNIQILNSYEEVVRNNNYYKGKGIENEKEIKDNCEIYLNENKINFNYKYELEGKNIIKIISKNSLNNTNYMFSNCSSLNSLNLSNFNTNNIINMSYMFSDCSSLTSLNLSNFNTNNVNNMSYMFSYCSSLNCKDEKILKKWTK